MLLDTLLNPTQALRRFAMMADGVRAAIAPRTNAATAPGRLLHFLDYYLHRSLNRLAALHQAWRDGTLRAPQRPPAPAPSARRCCSSAIRNPACRAPMPG